MNHRPFMEAIINGGDDDTPRLVYADWLEEQGFEHRASFIRASVEFERIRCHDCESLFARWTHMNVEKYFEAYLVAISPSNGKRYYVMSDYYNDILNDHMHSILKKRPNCQMCQRKVAIWNWRKSLISKDSYYILFGVPKSSLMYFHSRSGYRYNEYMSNFGIDSGWIFGQFSRGMLDQLKGSAQAMIYGPGRLIYDRQPINAVHVQSGYQNAIWEAPPDFELPASATRYSDWFIPADVFQRIQGGRSIRRQVSLPSCRFVNDDSDAPVGDDSELAVVSGLVFPTAIHAASALSVAILNWYRTNPMTAEEWERILRDDARVQADQQPSNIGRN